MFSIKNAFDVYQKTKSLGEKSINSEYIFVIDGEPDVEYLMKQFPLPITAPEDIIEVPMVGGIKGGTQQIPRFDHRGTCALAETVSGHARALLERAQATRTVSQRPKFSGTIYHGTPDNHTQKWRIIDAQFFGFDPVDVDVENRGQLTVYSGQIFYMYFPGIE